MKNARDLLARIVRELTEDRTRFALIGAIAVGIRAIERTTKDVDFTVSVDSDEQAEEIVYNLQKRGHYLHTLLEHKPSGAIAAARFVLADSKVTEPNLDLLFCHSGIEKEVVAAAESIQVVGINLPVATRGHLIALKLLSESDLRNRDRDDLLNLIEQATLEDLTQASKAIKLIEGRGFNQGKNLQTTFDDFRTRVESAKKRS